MMTEHALVRSTAAALWLRWEKYYELCKPKVVLLIAFTAFVGMLLAVDGAPPLLRVLAGVIGIALAAAGGAALNHVVDRKLDAAMERTQHRPLPRGELGNGQALVFALAIGGAGVTVLALFVNPLTAALTFAALIGYAVIYTVFLKHATPLNIVLGGAAGAAPPLLGWTAMTGEVTASAWLLFLIVFMWTPPHFWPLAIRRRQEYARVGVPMLPVTHGVEFTTRRVLQYTVLLVAITLLPFLTHMSGWLYFGGALLLGAGFLFHAVALWFRPTDAQAMRTFLYSIFYLSSLFGLLLADHYVRLLLRL
jgi:heme o synthase